MGPSGLRALWLWLLLLLVGAPASAEPIGWPQPGGRGTDVLLTYSFSNLFDGGFNSRLSALEMREATALAFAVWARYAPLHFREVRDSGPAAGEREYPAGRHPNIRIGYLPALAGEAAAHAHLPFVPQRSGLAGDIHFSNQLRSFGARTWGAARTGPFVLDFFSAMLHEVGHAVGLMHLDDPSAVMGTVFLVFLRTDEADLQAADIRAIRAVYGTGRGSVHALDRDFVVTPEPGTIVLIATGLGLAARRMRRSRRPDASNAALR